MKKLEQCFKNNKRGITLIALVVTIIVLLILAGVTIATLTGDNGILTKAQEAKNKTEQAQKDEEDILNSYEDKIKQMVEETWNGEVNAPNLKNGMKAVYWDDTGKEVLQDDSNFDINNWYDYANNKWANAKTEDGSYWVWIPRFEYQVINDVTNSNEAGTVNINFISTDTTEPSNSEYYIHPAFRNDIKNGGWDEEISGFWVAKYEMSMEDGEGKVVTTENGNVALSDNVKMVSKPGVSSWRYINLANSYTNSYNYDREKESHLIKNSEWGAVALLAHSKYGRDGEEIAINNSSTFTTGSSAGRAGASPSDPVFSYETVEGQKASTTGNITGVYDLSGGSLERVAAFNSAYQGIYFTEDEYLDVEGNYFASTNGTSTKYATAYSNNTSTFGNDFSVGTVSIKGDAIEEVYVSGYKGWFNDNSYFIASDSPVFDRGGLYNAVASGGIFCTGGTKGGSGANYGFRVVLI